MRKLTAAVALAALVVLPACAKKASEVNPTYVSPTRYTNLTCDQIGEELNRVASDLNRLTADQDEAATRDAVVTGVGLVLFWPALALLAIQDSDGELARIKGEYEALDAARMQKRCVA